jgi:hypothetical protein
MAGIHENWLSGEPGRRMKGKKLVYCGQCQRWTYNRTWIVRQLADSPMKLEYMYSADGAIGMVQNRTSIGYRKCPEIGHTRPLILLVLDEILKIYILRFVSKPFPFLQLNHNFVVFDQNSS